MRVVVPSDPLSEYVDAQRVDDTTCRLIGVPAFAGDYNFGDEVSVHETQGELIVDGLVRSGGWSNFGLIVDVSSKSNASRILYDLELEGCVVVGRKPLMTTLAVPSHAYHLARRAVEDGAARGLWEAGAILDRG